VLTVSVAVPRTLEIARGDSRVTALLAIALIFLAVLLAGGGILLLLLKLGVMGHYYTKPEPTDDSDGHTLAQSREAGRTPSRVRDEP
jgi:hypothetical protein